MIEPKDDRIEKLRETHELWDKYSSRWSFYLTAYEGGDDFARKDNLWKHQRENQADYNDRLDRIHNINYCEPLVAFFTNFIFNETIDRSAGAEQLFYEQFCKDVNRKGDDINSFMRQVHDDLQIFGMSYVIVDAPSLPDGVVFTKAQEEEQGIRPYWVLVKPEEIVDWLTDDFDNYLYVKRKQLKTGMLDGQRSKLEVYTEFFPNKIIVSTLDVTSTGKPEFASSVEMPNTLGTIPIVVSRLKRSKVDSYIGLSFLRDLAGNNREILNLTSLLQEFLYRQAFNILAVESDGMDDSGGELNVGANNVMQFPKGSEAPKYITPPSDPARFIQDERSRLKQEMFSIAAQDYVNELFNGEKSSGYSQAQSFSKTVPFISTRADILEDLESRLMMLTMKRVSKEWGGKIKYKDRYELTNLTDALTQLQVIVRDLRIDSETFVKEQLKRVVREYDGKLPRKVMAKVEKEIDDIDFKEWMEVQKTALVGSGLSPGDQQKPKQKGTLAEAAATANNQDGATNKVRKPKPKAA